MTQPALAWTDPNSGDRYYQGTDKHDKYLSVTSILGALPKQQYLMPWVAKVTAETAEEIMWDIEDWYTWAYAGGQDRPEWMKAYKVSQEEYNFDYELLAKDLAEVWKWERDSAGELGDEVHSAAEKLLNDSHGKPNVAKGLLCTTDYDTLTDQGRERLELLVKWLEQHTVEVVATEFTVYNDTYMYAGTCDIAAFVDGEPVYIDLKTGRDIYPEVALQLAAYSRGDYIRLALDLTADIPFDRETNPRSAVLHITKSNVKYIPIQNDDSVFRCFTDILNVKRHWVDNISKTVIGKPTWKG